MSPLTYVALGDSFTAGVAPGQPRWPDQIARALGPGARYENLATVGATSAAVERDQLGRAVALAPDLVSLVCGANDVLESTRPDVAVYAERLGRMFAHIRRELPAATLVTATYPDISRHLRLRPRSRLRVEAGIRRFNDATRRAAHGHGVVLLEGFAHPAATDRRAFGDDGFHPSEEGHRRAAREFLAALGDRLPPPPREASPA